MKNLQKQKSSSTSAFTLIELLVVTLMLGLVAGAISACLTGGMRAWESVQNFNSLELNVLPPLLSIEREMRNSMDFYGIEVEGGEQGIQFAALVPVSNDPDSPLHIGTVKYYFESSRKVLLRKAWVYKEAEPDRPEIIISGLGDIGFEYFYTSEADGVTSGVWDEYRESGTNYLNAVRIRLTSGVGRSETELVRTIVLPVTRYVKSET